MHNSPRGEHSESARISTRPAIDRRRFLGATGRAVLAGSAVAGLGGLGLGGLGLDRAAAAVTPQAGADDEVVFRPLRPVIDPTSNYPGFKQEAVTLPKGSTYGPAGPAPLGARWHGGTTRLPVDILLERDVAVPMRDGTTIYADVLRPPGDKDVPAIVQWSPYGKQGGYWCYCPGNIGAVPPLDRVSGLQKFEGLDPARWVEFGYAVIHPDPRGAFASEGNLRTWGQPEGRDAYDLIEWIAAQDWCSGRVGMAGNSWLTVSQYFAAAEQPPHLAAIAPWNGFFDIYDFVAPGGVPAPQFAELLTDFQWGTQMEWLPAMILKFPFKNDYWDEHDAQLETIDIPAYVAHSLPLGIHKWTPEAFRRISSSDKWLRLYNTHEWYDLYTEESVEDLKRFFDRYLMDIDNGWESTPRVRLCVVDPGLSPTQSANSRYANSTGYIPAAVVDRPEEEWPLARTRYTTLRLDAASRSLVNGPVADEATVRYPGAVGSVSFAYRFEVDTELTGYTVANLWIEVLGGNDADLFLDLHKLDGNGQELGLFEDSWLRVSHRELDPERSTSFVPYHHHRGEQLLRAGEIAQVSIGFAPNAMIFRVGEQLRLRVSGQALTSMRDPTGDTLGAAATALDPIPTKNVGPQIHVLHCGGGRDSNLIIPVVPPKD